MQSFKEFIDEAMTAKTRMKMRAAARKNKAKIALGRKKAAKKIASPEKIKARAEKQARNVFIKKILKGKNKNDLGFAARNELENKLKKKKGAIQRLAKKLRPIVKAQDRAKLKQDSGE
tara:strand:+ start:4994 stop:5347 length:354 start_codon:yes stop_codon:yes gene_type:complete